MRFSGLAPSSLKLGVVEIGDLPHYNQDDEANPPAAWIKFRDSVRSADAVLFVTPEYNCSTPGSIEKRAGCRVEALWQSVWSGKPGAVIFGIARRIWWFWRRPSLATIALYFSDALAMQLLEALSRRGADKFFLMLTAS